MKTFIYTSIALCAFAGNSILCRMALADGQIDAWSFTSIRLFSGIVILFLIVSISNAETRSKSKGSWRASLLLFLYALSFSLAYISLETGVGALILFTAVQITMVLAGIYAGNKLLHIEWLGLCIAFFGFVYLIFPSLSTPSLFGFILMAFSGIAWGAYSLAGKGSQDPLSDTTYNFIRTLPCVAILLIGTVRYSEFTTVGVLLAVASGAITSGIGYTVWYMALRGLSTTQAAVVQLFVPVLAVLGGVMFVSENLSLRLLFSSVLILGGISVVILGRKYVQTRALS
ncbi:MAG: DMT family transporter [Agarilytica sp.]